MTQPTNPTVPTPKPVAKKRTFGSINYDVPSHMRKLYPKLRALFKRRAIMQTQSSYLFPWHMAQEIEDGINQINSGDDGFPRPSGDKVRYQIFKYDEAVSGKALTESCRDAIRIHLRRMKDLIHKKLADIEKIAAGEWEGEDDLDMDDAIRSAKVTCRRASSILKDMQAVAMIFDLTDDMDTAFISYLAWVETKKDIVKDHETALKESIKEVEGDDVLGDEIGDKTESGGKTFSNPAPDMTDCPV